MGSAEPIAGDTELRTVLQTGLSEYFRRPYLITSLTRRPYDYWSSFSLEQVTLDSHGERLVVIFKDLGSRALSPEASRTRPAFLYEASREIQVYNRILRPLNVGTAVCYASSIDPASERYWLFLEKVDGRELFQVGEFEIWEGVARWLALLHRSATPLLIPANTDTLLVWDTRQYEQCFELATRSLSERVRQQAGGSALVTRITSTYQKIIRYLASLPRSFVHGEFYASNVIVQGVDDSLRVCPIDWETAGLGPAVLDLAALVAGRWTDEQRHALVVAYWNALTLVERAMWGSRADFDHALDSCRLHLAMLLLARSPDWEPPPEHKQDWLREADELSAKLRR